MVASAILEQRLEQSVGDWLATLSRRENETIREMRTSKKQQAGGEAEVFGEMSDTLGLFDDKFLDAAALPCCNEVF